MTHLGVSLEERIERAGSERDRHEVWSRWGARGPSGCETHSWSLKSGVSASRYIRLRIQNTTFLLLMEKPRKQNQSKEKTYGSRESNTGVG